MSINSDDEKKRQQDANSNDGSDSDTDSSDDEMDYDAAQIASMRRFVEKYRTVFSEVPSVTGQWTDKALPNDVALTGATGGLGAHFLDRFLLSSAVGRVFCLVRASDNAMARKRVNDTLRLHKLKTLEERQDPDRVIALASSVEQEYLGVGKESYEDMRQHVGIVVHNAWQVDFNMSIESFEPQIKGFCSLLNLAITARDGHPGSFFFSSSVSVVSSTRNPTVPEATSQDPTEPAPMGYSRGKWVGEQLCSIAGKTRGVRSEVFRLGQMVGDTQHGIWNNTEAIPLMIKSAQTIGALPVYEETVSWLPVDLAAAAGVEIALAPYDPSDGAEPAVWHVVNPDEQTTWNGIVASLHKAGLGSFDDLPPSEWLQKLKTVPDPSQNPTVKLFGYFYKKV
jgi:thioester reductase-like protein